MVAPFDTPRKAGHLSRFSRKTLGDLALSGAVIAGAAILFIGAAELPAPRFEPLGSAAAPRILGTILILLALIVAVQALMTRAPVDEPARLPWRGTLVLVALLAFVAALDFGRAPFVPAATLFVMATGVIMSRPTFRNALIFAALGLIVSALLSWILGTFLFITIG